MDKMVSDSQVRGLKSPCSFEHMSRSKTREMPGIFEMVEQEFLKHSKQPQQKRKQTQTPTLSPPFQ